MKKLLLLPIAILFFSCGTTKVNYDYDNTTDFTAYTTFNYFDDLDTGLSQLDEKRLMNAMDIALQAKGLKFSEEPDIFINIKSTVFQSQPNNSVGVGLGGGGGNVGGGLSVGIPVGGPKLSRELLVDFVDAKKDILVWQAISESAFKEGDPPATKEQKIQTLVTKIFDKYPPKQKK